MVGGFALGYAQGIQSIVGGIGKIIVRAAGGIPDLGSAVSAKAATYIQQSVNPNLNTYLAVGVVLVVSGFALIVMGDRWPKSTQGAARPQSKPLTVKQQ